MVCCLFEPLNLNWGINLKINFAVIRRAFDSHLTFLRTALHLIHKPFLWEDSCRNSLCFGPKQQTQQGYLSTVRMEVVVAANRPKPVWLLHLPHTPCLYMFNLHMCTLFLFSPSVVSPEAKSPNYWKIQPPFFTQYCSVYNHVEPVGKSASLCPDMPKGQFQWDSHQEKEIYHHWTKMHLLSLFRIWLIAFYAFIFSINFNKRS